MFTLIILLINSGSAVLPERILSCSLPVWNHVKAIYKQTNIAPIGSKYNHKCWAPYAHKSAPVLLTQSFRWSWDKTAIDGLSFCLK